jgi:hypothetical protein
MKYPIRFSFVLMLTGIVLLSTRTWSLAQEPVPVSAPPQPVPTSGEGSVPEDGPSVRQRPTTPPPPGEKEITDPRQDEGPTVRNRTATPIDSPLSAQSEVEVPVHTAPARQPKLIRVSNEYSLKYENPGLLIEVGPAAPIIPSNQEMPVIDEWITTLRGKEYKDLKYDVLKNERFLDLDIPRQAEERLLLLDRFTKISQGVFVDDLYIRPNRHVYRGEDRITGQFFDPTENDREFDEADQKLILSGWEEQAQKDLIRARLEDITTYRGKPTFMGILLNNQRTGEDTQQKYLYALHPMFSGNEIDANFLPSTDGWASLSYVLPGYPKQDVGFIFYWEKNGLGVEYGEVDQHILRTRLRRLTLEITVRLRRQIQQREGFLAQAEKQLKDANDIADDKTPVLSKPLREESLNRAKRLLSSAGVLWDQNGKSLTERFNAAKSRINTLQTNLQNQLEELPYPAYLAIAQGCAPLRLRQENKSTISLVLGPDPAALPLAKFSAPLHGWNCLEESLLVEGEWQPLSGNPTPSALAINLKAPVTNLTSGELARSVTGGLFLFQGQKTVGGGLRAVLIGALTPKNSSFGTIRTERLRPGLGGEGFLVNLSANKALEIARDGSFRRRRLNVGFPQFRFILTEGNEVIVLKEDPSEEIEVVTLPAFDPSRISASGETLGFLATRPKTPLGIDPQAGGGQQGLYIYHKQQLQMIFPKGNEGFERIGVAEVHDGQDGFRVNLQGGEAFLDVSLDGRFSERRLRSGVGCTAHYLASDEKDSKTVRLVARGKPDRVLGIVENSVPPVCSGSAVSLYTDRFTAADTIKQNLKPGPGATTLDKWLTEKKGKAYLQFQGDTLVSLLQFLEGMELDGMSAKKEGSAAINLSLNGAAHMEARIAENGTWLYPTYLAPSDAEAYGLLRLSDFGLDLLTQGNKVRASITGLKSAVSIRVPEAGTGVALIGDELTPTPNNLEIKIARTPLTITIGDGAKSISGGRSLLFIIYSNALTQVAEPNPRRPDAGFFKAVGVGINDAGERMYRAWDDGNREISSLWLPDGSDFEHAAATETPAADDLIQLKPVTAVMRKE